MERTKQRYKWDVFNFNGAKYTVSNGQYVPVWMDGVVDIHGSREWQI
jgi:hypothetical protein